MPYTTFDQVMSLDTPTQRRLLLNGEPAERVWAAWALGLQYGKSINPELVTSLHQSPHPGTRRQLIVILAGHGERDILETLAQSDPDEFVRATACQYLIQTAHHDDTRLANFIINRLTSDSHPAVHHAILKAAQTGFPRLSQPLLNTYLSHPDLETRKIAFDVLRSQTDAYLLPQILTTRLADQTDPDFRLHLLASLVKSGNSNQLLETAYHSDSLRLEILDTLIQSRQFFTSQELMPFITITNFGITNHLLHLLDPTRLSDAVPFLLACINQQFSDAATVDEWEYDDTTSSFLNLIEHRLTQAISQFQRDSLSPQDKSSLFALINHLEQKHQDIINDEYYDDYYYFAVHEIASVLKLLRILQALA